jgi:aspartate/methionine/tyrosine aminotransferase
MMDLALGTAGALRLDVGDPDFPTPAHIAAAAARAAADGFTHYGPSAGLGSLRELAAAKVEERNGFACSPDQVVVTTGGCGALFATFLALLDPGDEVLIPDPGWTHYVPMARAVSAVPMPYRLERAEGFEPDFDALRKRIGKRSRLIVINSPGNPTGAVFSRETVVSVLELAQKYGLWVVADECYDELVLEGAHVSARAVGDAEHVVSVFSFSKTYAMTGWRVGYLVAPRALAPVLAHVQEPVVSCPSTVAQKAAEAALAGPQEPVAWMRAAYRRRRDIALERLGSYGISCVRPRGAFYVMVDVSNAAEPSESFARRLLEERRVAVVPGSAFGEGGEGMVRVSLAASDDAVETGVERLAAALEQRPVAA